MFKNLYKIILDKQSFETEGELIAIYSSSPNQEYKIFLELSGEINDKVIDYGGFIKLSFIKDLIYLEVQSSFLRNKSDYNWIDLNKINSIYKQKFNNKKQISDIFNELYNLLNNPKLLIDLINDYGYKFDYDLSKIILNKLVESMPL